MFRYVRINSERRLLAFLVSLRPSVRTYQRGFCCTDFRGIWCWELLMKIFRDLLNLVEIGQK